jgi:hypothetical protein
MPRLKLGLSTVLLLQPVVEEPGGYVSYRGIDPV